MSSERDNPEMPSGTQLKIVTLVSAVGIGVFMSSLDASIVVVILNNLRSLYSYTVLSLSEFGGIPQLTWNFVDVTPTQIQWVMLSYLLIMMAFTVIAGDLGDRFSNKRIFQYGMIFFAIGSLFCYLSIEFLTRSIWWLVLSRVIQSLGATGMIANGMALVTRFTTKKNRGTAVGINNVVISLAVILGPIFGTVINQYWNIGGVFLINLPIAVIGLTLVHFNIPKTPPLAEKKTADYLGSFLFAAFLMILVLSFSVFPETDTMPNARMLAGIAFGFSLFILPFFIWWERKTSYPLIDFKMLKNKKISIGLVTAILKHQGYIVIIFHFVLFLPEFGITHTPIELGLVLSGIAVGMAIFAAVSGKLSNTVDARYLCTGAMMGVAIMLAVLSALIDANAHISLYVVSAIVIGICIGMFQSPNGNSIMSAAPKEKLGIASALHGLTTSVGISLGTALSTAILALVAGLASTKNGLPIYGEVNYAIGLKWVFGVYAVITFLGAILSYFRGPEDRSDDEPVEKVMKTH